MATGYYNTIRRTSFHNTRLILARAPNARPLDATGLGHLRISTWVAPRFCGALAGGDRPTGALRARGFALRRPQPSPDMTEVATDALRIQDGMDRRLLAEDPLRNRRSEARGRNQLDSEGEQAGRITAHPRTHLPGRPLTALTRY